MTAGKGSILIVDDESESLALLSNILGEAGYQVRPADSGKLALASVSAVVPDLILLDLHMPGMDGLEVCRQLKASQATRDIPVMFISASTDKVERVQGLALGAVDYVSKPFERAELLARVRTHVELSRLRTQLERQVSDRTRDVVRAVSQLQRALAERKRTRQALIESEGRFRQMADTAPVMIVVADPDQRATFFNRGWLDFTGRSMEEELGNGWTVSLHPEDHDRCLTGIASSFEHRRECQLEYRLRAADGEYRWVVCRGVPRFEPNGTFAGYVASLIDVTELKRAQEEALAGQRLESLGVLATGIAHDFNNLLSSILADSELMLAEVPEGSPLRENIERMEAVALRAAGIVRQLMVYAGHESTVLEEVDLAALVREMLDLIKVSMSKNARLEIELAEGLPPIRANTAQMRQVVMNLITNASDALEDRSGTIGVRLTRVTPAEDPLIEQAVNISEKGYLSLVVSDTGCGMTEENRSRIFEPFFTTKSVGRGLGLAAVQGIVRSHGGAITVSSEPGRGSRFEVQLPCTGEPSLRSDGTTVLAGTEEKQEFNGTVLLIDDEDTLRLAVVKMLRRKGFAVFEAADGRAGVDLFRTHATDIDAVLLDVTLPGMLAREVYGELRKIRPHVKIILTTAHPRERAFAGVGADESSLYIRKPYQLDELAELLRQVCRLQHNSAKGC